MANEKNLLKGDDVHKFTLEEASKGGKASAEARRKKRDLRNALEMLLEKEFVGIDGTKKTGTEVIASKLFEQAIKGNVKAFETIRATVGQDPVQKLMISEVDQDVINEVERMVLNEEE